MSEEGQISFVKVICITIIFMLVFFGVVWFTVIAGETVQVAHDQLGPKAILVKYEWFKDMSAALDSKLSTIDAYNSQLREIEVMDGQDRKNWPDGDLNTYNSVTSARLGLIGLYNNEAAQYNSNMAKVNYYWANAGNLPQGGKALPKEYRRYIDKISGLQVYE
ncbi:MAG: hypothetical protein PHW52_01550 [Candidatus Pacebacteria bacterium]|nr:hypothetical protein [Candidatus Paceibacterota bacterium]